MCFTQIQPIKDYTTISLLKISISTTWFTCIIQIKRTYSRVVMRLTEKIKGYEGLEKLIEQLKHGQIMNKFILVQQPKIEIQILNNFFLPLFFFFWIFFWIFLFFYTFFFEPLQFWNWWYVHPHTLSKAHFVNIQMLY